MAAGLNLFGPPVIEADQPLGPVEIKPEDLRLVAYESLVIGQPGHWLRHDVTPTGTFLIWTTPSRAASDHLCAIR